MKNLKLLMMKITRKITSKHNRNKRNNNNKNKKKDTNGNI